jgi:thioredoxin reductase (NADPH)
VSEQRIHDLIIVGSGPAGYTAALYGARAQLDVVVFEGSQFGGALMTTTGVENYPGFAEEIQGPDLMDQMRRQAERFGAVLRPEDVEALDLDAEVKSVTVNGGTHRARAVILAMGAAPRYLGVPGEQELLGHGVSACATCDGFFFREHDIVVVGGGDSAMEEATFLTRFANSVTIVHRREEFRASGIMLERARQNEKITFRTNAIVEEVLGDTAVTGVRVRDTVTGRDEVLAATGMFVAIGHDPRSALVAGQVETDDEGYVLVDTPSTYTNLPGVFACGDLIDKTYQQAVTAAGSGCTASIDAERWLAENPNTPEPATAPKPTVDSVREPTGPHATDGGSVTEGSTEPAMDAVPAPS